MANLFDYLSWRGDLSFQLSPFNEIDSLILTRLSYFPMDGIVSDVNLDIAISDVCNQILSIICDENSDTFKKIHVKDDIRLIRELRDSPRFKDLGLSCYENHIDVDIEQQFSAVTIRCDAETNYIAFRGTDNTLVGWKEDFNMNFIFPIPSQRESVNYLKKVAANDERKLIVGGHSKGGNLAVYSAAFCGNKIQKRILRVFNHDGPGFTRETLDEPGYKNICAKVETSVPQSSVFGMLLEHEESYRVTHSTSSGLMQHDLYSWELHRNRFVTLDTVTNSSKFINRTIKEWVGKITLEERETFIDAIFEVFSSINVETMHELTATWYKHPMTILKTYVNMDERTRKLVGQLIIDLLKTAKDNISLIRDNENRNAGKSAEEIQSSN